MPVSPVLRSCPSCRSELAAEHRYCPVCGHDTSAPGVARSSIPAADSDGRGPSAGAAPAPQPPSSLAAGVCVDEKYEVVERLGAGSFGEVFRVRHRVLETEMALKTLHPYLAHEPQVRERFLREARILVGLQHPNLVGLHDAGEWRGHLYMAMDLCRGRTLSAEIRARGRIPGPEAASLAGRILAALECAHAQGVIHRDLKPANVMLVPFASAPAGSACDVKVLDFGVAKVLHGPADGDGPSLTLMGAAVGTLAYMSPEQAQGHTIDPRSDLYSLGVILYQMVSGRRPFDGESLAEVIKKILVDPPPPLDVPELEEECPGLSGLITEALAKDPAARPASAIQMRRRLDAIAQAARTLRGTRAGPEDPDRQETLLDLREAAVVAAGDTPTLAPPGRVATAARDAHTAVPLRRTAGAPAGPAHPAATAGGSDTAPRRSAGLAAAIACLGLGFAVGGVVVWAPWKPSGAPASKNDRRDDPVANTPVVVHGTTPPAVPSYLVELGAVPPEGGTIELLRPAAPVRAQDGFEAGTELALLAVPAEGWLFDGWEDGHPSPEKRTWYVRPGENRVVAQFRRTRPQTATPTDPEAPPAADPNAADAAVEEGEACRRLSDSDGALAAYDRAIEIDPTLANAWYGRAAVHIERGEFAVALDDVNRLLELAPRLAVAWCARATIRAAQGELDGADEDLARAFEIEPNLTEAWANRAWVRFLRSDLDGAIADATHALEIDAAHVTALSVRAGALQAAGRIDEAIVDLEVALRSLPEDSPAREAIESRREAARAARR